MKKQLVVAVVTAMAGYEAKELLLLYINEVKYGICNRL